MRSYANFRVIFILVLAFLLQWRVILWIADCLVPIGCDLCFSNYLRVVSVELINLQLKLNSITVAHLPVFQVSPPIGGSNFARNLSP